MKKSKPSIKNVLTPKDSISAVVIVIGIAIAIFIDETEIKLIGMSVSILGLVALFMTISQRLKDYLDGSIFKKSPAAPNLTIVEKVEGGATRQIIEDLDDSLDKDFDKVKKQDSVASQLVAAAENLPFTKKQNKAKSQAKAAEMGYQAGDEGFKVIKKGDKTINPPSSMDNKASNTDNASSAKAVSAKNINQNNEVKASYFPEDDFSSIRIVSKGNNKTTAKEEAVLPSSNAESLVFDDAANFDETIKFDETVKIKPIAKNQNEASKAGRTPIIDNSAQYQSSNSKDDEKCQCKKQQIDLPTSILMDDSIGAEEPRNEFAGFVSRALMVIRSMASTTTIAFFLVNMEKQKLILETFVSDVPEAIIDNPKIPMGNDIITQITKSGKPEILTDINSSAELDLIPYYKSRVGSKSFIGVPIYYQNSILGVICADTKLDDAYDNLTAGFMGHFTKLIASLIVNYTEKYELKQASRVLDAICDIRNLISTSSNQVEEIAAALQQSSEEIFDYKSMGVICFNFQDSKWKIYAHNNKNTDSTLLNKNIDLDRSMLGETIKRGISLNISLNENSPTRVHPSEEAVSQGYFVSAPIIAMDKIYGAVYFEAASKSNVTSYDIKILETLAEQAAVALEQIHLNSTITTSTLLDSETGLINITGFEKRLSEELHKSEDFGIPVVLAAIKIDNYSSFNPEQYRDRYNKVVNIIIDTIQNKIKPYDILSRSNEGIFYLALIGLPLSEAQLWAERLRSEVAQKVLNIDKKKLSVTISSGISANAKGDTHLSLMEKSAKALDIASRKTNNVTIFG